MRERVLPGGMVKLELVLSPDEADLVLRAIDRAREVHHEAAEDAETAAIASAETPKCDARHNDASAEAPTKKTWPSRADGAVALAESFLAGHPVTGTGGERFQVMVHLDQDVLGPDGAFAGTLEDGTHLSGETLCRLACDCGLVPVGHHGEKLDIGRRSRSIPPAIRRALLLRDRGCAFPGCTHTHFLHGHHIEHWFHGGETSLGNLITLCTVHHHMVHEGGWTISLEADGRFLFHSPAGRSVEPEPPREWADNVLALLRQWADDHDLDLGPDANEPQWDGTKPDYEWAVSALLAAG